MRSMDWFAAHERLASGVWVRREAWRRWLYVDRSLYFMHDLDESEDPAVERFGVVLNSQFGRPEFVAQDWTDEPWENGPLPPGPPPPPPPPPRPRPQWPQWPEEEFGVAPHVPSGDVYGATPNTSLVVVYRGEVSCYPSGGTKTAQFNVRVYLLGGPLGTYSVECSLGGQTKLGAMSPSGMLRFKFFGVSFTPGSSVAATATVIGPLEYPAEERLTFNLEGSTATPGLCDTPSGS